MESNILFYALSTMIVLFSFFMLISANPVYSALFLVLTMIGLAGIYFTLNAYFIAGVQLIVYAGAVMVLFVMVLMLFDLKKEVVAFSKGIIPGLIKLISVGILFGLVIAASNQSTDMMLPMLQKKAVSLGYTEEMKTIANLLYSKYLLAFEVLGVLLLLIAVGVVAVAKSKGGTHARS